MEETLLGEAGEGSLKARLERLVATASRFRPRIQPVAVPLEELVQGMRIENERGEFFLMEADVHLEARQGEVPLSRFRAVAPATVGVLTAEPELTSFDLSSAVFLDTETTGLAGGAGTAALPGATGYVGGDPSPVPPYLTRQSHAH